MFNFLAGLAVGTAFAPFWMMVWSKIVKPAIDKVINKQK